MVKQKNLNTPASKKSFALQTLREWAAKFRITDDITVHFPPAQDEANDALLNPPYLNIEEGVITRIERAFVGEKSWKRIHGLAKGQSVACLDTDKGEYQKFALYLFPALMALDGEEFKELCTATIVHELLHVVMFPFSSYARSLEAPRG